MDNLEFRKFLNGYGLTYEQYEVLPEEQKLELEKRFRVQSKSGKTNVIGEGLKGVGCILILIGEGGAEVYSIATKADQSRIIFNEAVHMVQQSPHLSKYIVKRKTDMYMPATFSTMAPLASETKSLDGLNSHCVIIDELHAIRNRSDCDSACGDNMVDYRWISGGSPFGLPFILN